MHFDNTYITLDGKERFTIVNAGKSKLVWTKIYASKFDLDNDSTINADNISSKNVFSDTNKTGDGNIEAIQINDHDKRITQLQCTITNDNYSGIANCIGLYAHLESESQDTLMMYATLGNAQPETITAKPEPFVANINVNIEVSDKAIETFSPNESWYASSQSLKNEKEARESFDNRCVTTHTANSSSAGEPQNIYGEKSFYDNTIFYSNIFPSKNNTSDIGSINRKLKNVYATTFIGSVNGNATSATTATNLSAAPTLSWSDATSSTNGSTLTVTAGGKASESTTITTVRRAYEPFINTASTNESFPLVFTSSTTAGFKDLYTDTANSLYYNSATNTLTCPTINTVSLTCSVINISAIANNNADYQLIVEPANVNSNTELAIHPNVNNYCWLGTPDKKFYKMYATSIYGDYFYGKFSVLGNSTNSSYPLIFADSVNTNTTTSNPRTLYTDTANSLYYNPSTNTLACDKLACDTITSDTINVKKLAIDQASRLDFYKMILSDLGLYRTDIGQYYIYYVHQIGDSSHTPGTAVASMPLTIHEHGTISTSIKYVLSQNQMAPTQIYQQSFNTNTPKYTYTVTFIQSYGKYYTQAGTLGEPGIILAKRTE